MAEVGKAAEVRVEAGTMVVARMSAKRPVEARIAAAKATVARALLCMPEGVACCQDQFGQVNRQARGRRRPLYVAFREQVSESPYDLQVVEAAGLVLDVSEVCDPIVQDVAPVLSVLWQVIEGLANE